MRRALDVVNQAEEIPNIEELNEVIYLLTYLLFI